MVNRFFNIVEWGIVPALHLTRLFRASFFFTSLRIPPPPPYLVFDPPRLTRLLSKFCFATVSYFLSFHPPFLFLTRSLPCVPTFPPFFGEIFLLPILFIIHVEYLLTYLLNIKHTTDYCTTSSIFRKSHLFSPFFSILFIIQTWNIY